MNNWQGMVELVMIVECIVCILFFSGCFNAWLFSFYSLEFFFFFLICFHLVVNLTVNFVILREIKYWFIYIEICFC